VIHGSIFKNVHDKRPGAIPPVSFSELIDALTAEAFEAAPADKTEQTCISPAVYPPGATRGKAAALSWDWFAADVDNKLGNFPGSTIDDIIRVMRGLNTPWFIYTTASSRSEAECFRLMFPIDRPILHSEFDVVWQAFSQMLPIDPATKDISRIFIVPRKWAGRENRIEFELGGEPVSVDQIVRRFPAPKPKPPVISTLPPAMTSAPRTVGTMKFAQPSLNAPYVPPQAIEEALSAPQGGRMYGFLVRIAFRALRMGYEITPYDLEVIGTELAMMLGRSRDDIRHDAESAHRYAALRYVEDRADQFTRLQSALRPKRFGKP
jgi:hypothetical protein